MQYMAIFEVETEDNGNPRCQKTKKLVPAIWEE